MQGKAVDYGQRSSHGEADGDDREDGESQLECRALNGAYSGERPLRSANVCRRMQDYLVTNKAHRDTASLVPPTAGPKSGYVIATGRPAKDFNHLAVGLAGLDLRVVVRSHLAAGKS